MSFLKKKVETDLTQEKQKKKTAGALITVLMLGQRRAGKSSVLSSMLDSLSKQAHETGLRFSADESMTILMNKKKSQLNAVFTAHRGEPYFTTFEGTKNGISYSELTDASVVYRFKLGLQSRKSSKSDFLIDFVDIRGEDMTDDDSDINDLIAQSSILLIAIDSPALMEGTTTSEGYGEYHETVNIPSLIYSRITQADIKFRNMKKGKGSFLPRLVLFVPLKCEKYYYNGGMGELNKRVKAGYKTLFEFFDAHKEYNVAITPILTLGDVVFDHYEMEKRSDGVEVPVTFGPDAPEDLRYLPSQPMYKFRTSDGHYPQFSPQYCEQPLYYLLSYILSIYKTLSKMAKTTGEKVGEGFIAVGGGILGLSVKSLVKFLFKDLHMLLALRRAAALVKTSGDGFEIVYDRLNIAEGSKE